MSSRVGEGVIYSYDAIGSFELMKYAVQGSAQSHIIPILDSCVAKKNRNEPYVDLDREEAVNLVKEVFTAGTEVICYWRGLRDREKRTQATSWRF